MQIGALIMMLTGCIAIWGMLIVCISIALKKINK